MDVFHLNDLAIDLVSPDNDIKKLMQTVKPDWEQDKIQIKNLSGGYSCGTYKVRSENEDNDVLIVRVRKLFSDHNIITNPDFENKVVEALSKANIFAKVYAVFKNGYCYQFLDGKPLLNLTVPDENVAIEDYPFKEIAIAMARIHSEKLVGEDFTEETSFEKIKNVLKNDYPNNPDIPQVSELEIELEQLCEVNKKFQQNIVLCHGDTHAGNIIWDKETGATTFVDWEVAHIGYPAYDIAYFFDILDSKVIIPSVQMPTVDPGAVLGIKMQFIRDYLEKWSELQQDVIITDEIVENFHKEIEFFRLIVYINVVVMLGAITAKAAENVSEDLPTTPNEFILSYFKAYQDSKEEILALLDS
uniref:ethanolamine kinase n=1 Tax=Strigamia maritima TaxID=126957 RepID=T1JBA0_STRMM